MKPGKCCVLLSCVVVLGFAIGCGKEEEPARQQAQQPTAQIAVAPVDQPAVQIQDISDNPAFYSAEGHAAQADFARDLDAAFRPVLSQVLKDAKLLSECDALTENASLSAEVVFVTRQLFASADADALHRALLDAGFHPTPRLGARPSHGRKAVLMSLSTRVQGRYYHVQVTVDLSAQVVRVGVYRPDPQKDRML